MEIQWLLIMMAVGFQALPEGEGVCCRPELRSIGVRREPVYVAPTGSFICPDCTSPDPCCSLKGSCNLFCCNCVRGCRRGCRAARAVRMCVTASVHGGAQQVLEMADTDGDRRLSVAEALGYVAGRSHHDNTTLSAMLMDMDMDNDMYLSVAEIDPS